MKKSRSPKNSDKDEVKSTNEELKKGSNESVFDNGSTMDSTTKPDTSNFDNSKSNKLESQGSNTKLPDDLSNHSLIPRSVRKTEQVLINILQNTTENSPNRAFVLNFAGVSLFFIYNAN